MDQPNSMESILWNQIPEGISSIDVRPCGGDEVQIEEQMRVKISTTLMPQLENDILEVLKHNSSAFAWSLSDMLGIDPNFLCHKLALDPSTKLVIQKKRKSRKDKIRAIVEETRVNSLANVPIYQSNIKMVKLSVESTWTLIVLRVCKYLILS